ncbi:MAG: tRNA (adenosine(37)-N6)-threonylcarbamoyltransferase complex dimerization subunit type 1 TsaB [Pseudomonadota bacterium]
MLTLAVDTALAHCQAAVLEGEGDDLRVVAQSGSPATGDAEAILEHGQAAMDAAGIGAGAIGRVAVTVGPGSFTGVRVGIAYAKGVAFAGDLPVYGVPTLEIMARAGKTPALGVIDARHGALFAGLYLQAGAPAQTLARLSVAACAELAATTGAVVRGDAASVAALGSGEVVERIDLKTLCRLALETGAPREARALYLAPVDAKPQRHKSLARA